MASELGLVLDTGAGDANLDPATVQVAPAAGVVVALVGVHLLRVPSGPAGVVTSAADGGAGDEQRLDIFESRVLSAESSTCSGNPLRSTSRWYFEPGLLRSAGLAPISSPPFFARTDTEPTLARGQSKTSASESSSSTRRCSRSHTPEACNARSRRQAVCPEPQPSAGGRSRQRQPVLRTNKMPSSTARSSIGGRPPRPRAGINGPSYSHRLSSTNRCC